MLAFFLLAGSSVLIPLKSDNYTIRNIFSSILISMLSLLSKNMRLDLRNIKRKTIEPTISINTDTTIIYISPGRIKANEIIAIKAKTPQYISQKPTFVEFIFLKMKILFITFIGISQFIQRTPKRHLPSGHFYLYPEKA